MNITPEHVQELSTLHGENVLVVLWEGQTPWVIGTENRHYQGAHIVIATSEQVMGLLEEDDWVNEEEISQEAAQRIADALMANNSTAFETALGMRNPGGHPDAPSGLPGDGPLTGVEWRKRQAMEKTDGDER